MIDEDDYFILDREPVPKELPPKTITFIIDPSLSRIWTRIGYKDPDVAAETNKLDIALTKTYLEFIAQASSKCDEINKVIYQRKKDFNRLKKLYNDDKTKLDINDQIPLGEQENIIAREIENMTKKYAPRVALLRELHRKCKNHFDKLAVEDSERGEYIEVGTTDYSQERVERFKKILIALKKEEANRVNIYRSCEKSIKAISKELEEPLSDQVVFIFANELVDTDSIQALTQASEDLTELKINRYKEYDQLVKSLQHLYKILQVPPDEQIDIPPKPTRIAIDLLRTENDLRQQTVTENLELLIDQFQTEIKLICDEMHIPDKLRPKYVGDDLDEKLQFLEKAVKTLRYRLSKTQPIIELLSKIEEIKQTPSPKIMKSKNPHITQQLLDKQNQEKINIELPPLERKLLELLIEFRYENGFDFQFEGVTYIDTLSQTYLANDDDKFGKTVLEHKSPTPSPTPSPTKSPRQQSAKKYTPKKSPYSPKKTRRMLDL
ncbi:hypothetical protein TRFO_40983 [Tritrichomonas foetus]|uniref:Uncharacterized protein n=1 Tax=Tritrichomonas foetus TaxID=1144522 RepID=A0A1J4IZB3_9EUKA|nr:hypothetical protein TRFO_40983 [Tritrichomonas foetus]|eukprot:OHS92696.1 hypothetical protein TRFO_40983 [Tritrichomonas foetus]